ncbi:voltage-gated potassium channel [Lentibacillus halodurans]|uniref:Voltage-gated potassium channel n=1 Tax=Lentibacillus halodurans TaxID=237679 RepID=A0A1I0YQS3_9BACI|nr:transporter [Lentibacillus halodurans]SFB15739.1 voltage-gated potassium channel [Lentibacillus halodurans]
MQKILKMMYESIMILLVMLTIITIWTDETYNSAISWIVWAVFFADFIVRFIISNAKWDFITQNPFLLIAIIPFDQFFQVARIVRIIYLFRIKTITKYYVVPFVEKLTIQSKSLILSMVLLLLLGEAVLIQVMEDSVNTYFDGLFVVFGYLLFFGHRMLEIEQSISVWTLTAVSVLGIAIQGLALQWVFNKIDVVYRRLKDKYKSGSKEQELKSNGQ